MATQSVKKAAEITYHPAKKNPMFPNEMTACMRLVRSKQKIACADCGKVSHRNWTMVVPFRATRLGTVSLVESPTLLAPLTPVCEDHPLSPDETVMQEIAYSFRLWDEMQKGGR